MTSGAPHSDLARQSHYVPQSYLRRWSPGGNRVWSYRLLVPQERSLIWEFRSIRGVAVRRDLYTSVAKGKESDEIERWLNRDVEDPALPVLDRLCVGRPLTSYDRRKLARYLASLSARSPIYYSEHTRMVAEYLDNVLRESVEKSIRVINQATARGEEPPVPTLDPTKRWASLITEYHPKSEDSPTPAIHVRAVVGREMWLGSIEHVVNDLSPHLENHNWQIFRPHPGWVWYTSDHPLIRLNWQSAETYDLKGGFAREAGELLLPLSPTHLLYAQIKRPKKDIEVLSLEQTMQLKRIIAENAFRWIVADVPRRSAEWFKPRVVNMQQFVDEETQWSKFHDEQSAAELELHTPPGTPDGKSIQ